MKKILVLLTVGLLVPISASAQSTLALQEKCAESAKEQFIKERSGLRRDEAMNWSYTSHYNKKLDKCFILWEGSMEWKNEEKITITKSVKLLIDVYEGKGYATYIGFQHYYPRQTMVDEYFTVLEKDCKKSEYEIALKSYMEE
jgi:hypothetical protein